jgi:hypothetical protein
MDQSRRQFVLPPELKYSTGWRLNIIGEQLEPAQANVPGTGGKLEFKCSHAYAIWSQVRVCLTTVGR